MAKKKKSPQSNRTLIIDGEQIKIDSAVEVAKIGAGYAIANDWKLVDEKIIPQYVELVKKGAIGFDNSEYLIYLLKIKNERLLRYGCKLAHAFIENFSGKLEGRPLEDLIKGLWHALEREEDYCSWGEEYSWREKERRPWSRFWAAVALAVYYNDSHLLKSQKKHANNPCKYPRSVLFAEDMEDVASRLKFGIDSVIEHGEEYVKAINIIKNWEKS